METEHEMANSKSSLSTQREHNNSDNEILKDQENNQMLINDSGNEQEDGSLNVDILSKDGKEEKDHHLRGKNDNCESRKSNEIRDAKLAVDEQNPSKDDVVSKFWKDEDESDEDTVYNHHHHHRWYHVNMSIMPAKWCYFFECARKSAVNANMILFLTQIGLAKGEAGLILGFRLVSFLQL